MSTTEKVQKKVSLHGIKPLNLFGFEDIHLRRLEKEFAAKISARGSELIIEAEEEIVQKLERVVSAMVAIASQDKVVSEQDLKTIIETISARIDIPEADHAQDETVILYKKEGFIKPKSPGQTEFYRSALRNDIVFTIGPAGTGKTFLAVAMAVAALRDRLVDRIVLTRPAVEAGESLGYLPGDYREKIDPYLRPLYDALYEMLPADKLKKYIESRVIEIVPLAYMRGRTLNNSFVILDEAQNTTFNQMKMFLTRLGINSQSIITGDITQVDLPDKNASGLIQVQPILANIEGISFAYLTERDVVRHRLVQDIIRAYDHFENHHEN